MATALHGAFGARNQIKFQLSCTSGRRRVIIHYGNFAKYRKVPGGAPVRQPPWVSSSHSAANRSGSAKQGARPTRASRHTPLTHSINAGSIGVNLRLVGTDTEAKGQSVPSFGNLT